MDMENFNMIDLFNPNIIGENYKYVFGDEFFTKIGGIVSKGDIMTDVTCVDAGTLLKFYIHSEGYVKVPCDRCLTDVNLRIDTTDELLVKLGDTYLDDGDIVVIPESEGLLDISQYVYEFIALSIPLKCVHEPGMCDTVMMDFMNKHQATRSCYEDTDEMDSDYLNADKDEHEIDQRWEVLKKLIDK